jgi:8-oxo-dGTP pyrophosphatase MutT (NUDIX family)/phosphohistidine phosphatase SixA
MASSKPESRLIKAAGAVAWRPGPDGRPEILLVHRRKYDDWSLPKGKVEPGETLPVTAVREVLEEGGARLALGRRLDSVRYNVGGRPKRVHYWSASVASVDDHAVPNDEVDQIEWVAADRAAERISYNRDNGVIADFARLPAQTVPVILLRHAKAVGKSNWKRADDRRPLDDAGRADAKALAELLACFGPRARLITSPAARCVETLRPFAQLSGAELREEPSLYIHHHSPRTHPADSTTSIAALLTEAITAGEPTIFCAHRENIPVLQAAALAALGLAQPPSDAAPGSALAGVGLKAFPELPKEWDDPLPTSGFWVLNLALPPPPATPPAPAAQSSLAAPWASAAPPAQQIPAWRRWFRARARIGAHTRSPRSTASAPTTAPTPPRSATTAPTTAATAPHGAATPPAPAASSPELLAAPVLAPEPTAARRTPATLETSAPPAPRLISADRYDLTEP